MKHSMPRAAVFFLAVLCTAFSATAPAEQVRFSIDPTHTFPMFEVSHLGYSKHRGRFNNTRGTLILDRSARTGEVEIVIDASSIDTGHDALEKALRSDGFFNVEQFPELRYRSTAMQFEEDRLVAVEGELTLLGETRPVRLTVDHFHCSFSLFLRRNVCGANATAQLLRSDFGMSKYILLGVGDEVKITLQVEAWAERLEVAPNQTPEPVPAQVPTPAPTAPAAPAPVPPAAS